MTVLTKEGHLLSQKIKPNVTLGTGRCRQASVKVPKRRFGITLNSIIFAVTAMALPLFAQDAVPAASSIPVAQPPVMAPTVTAPVVPTVTVPVDAPASSGTTLREAWVKGGSIMWVLLFVSVIMVTLVIYFFIVFRASAVVPRRHVLAVRDYIKAGDASSARRLCEDRTCAFSSVVLAVLDCVREANGSEDRQLMRDAVEAEGARQAESMQSRTQLLLDISSIAPMLGLLGTTFGMFRAFGAVAQDFVASKPVALANGVSEAIITTIFGLIVAIPAMAFYAYFRRRVSRLTGALEKASSELLTDIAAVTGRDA